MKVFLFGATGSTGLEILRLLIQDQHEVKVLVRDPQKLIDSELQLPNDQVELIKGEVFELDKLREHFQGCEIVISALGTGTSNSYTEIYSQGGRNILSAMRSSEVRKLITITSGLIDMSDPSTDNFFLNWIIRPNFNKVYSDQTKWETILDETKDIDWICVRPTYLTNKSFTGKYRVRDRHCPDRGRRISRADLADFIIKQIESDTYIFKKPVIAY